MARPIWPSIRQGLARHTPDGLVLAAVPTRADPRTCWWAAAWMIFRRGVGGHRFGPPVGPTTGLRSDLRFAELRGNIGTRLAKAADFDAVVMAKAALDRLGEHPPVVDVLGCEAMVPQVGQGALAVECREDDDRVRSVLAAIQDPVTRRVVDAERAFLATLGGDCTLPAGAHAHIRDARVAMRAVLADGPDGRCHAVVGEGDDGEVLGQGFGRQLLQAVAR